MGLDLGPGALVVLSNLHLGEDRALLSVPSVCEELCSELERPAESNGWPELRIVLLGDFLDLWLADLAHAVRAAKPLLQALCRRGASVEYVVGNHDHHMIVLLEELEFARSLQRGERRPVRFTVDLRFTDTFLDEVAPGATVRVSYPHLSLNRHFVTPVG